MKKIKVIFTLLVLSSVGLFAFNKINSAPRVKQPVKQNTPIKPLATTYFVFTGNSTSEYTDSTKWIKSDSDPTATCEGSRLACKVASASLSSRAQLVSYISVNGINGPSIDRIADKN